MSSFFCLEDLKGLPFGGSMDLHANLVPGPPQSPLIGVVDVPEAAAGQKVLAHSGHASLHLALVPGEPYFGRIGNKAVVPLQLPIGPIHGGIIRKKRGTLVLKQLDNCR